MLQKKKIVDARTDESGRISHVRFRGNSRFTSVENAIPIVERGDVDNAHVVHPKASDAFIRTNPDGEKGNNLDDMAN